MGGSGFCDGHEIDSMINSLNLPMENLEGSGLHAGDWDGGFQYLGLTSDALQGGFGPITSDALQGGLESLPSDTRDVLPCLSVPSNEASQPKQLLNFVEETSGASNTLHNDSSAGLHSGVSQAPSPVSVLESNGSCSVEKSVPISSETVIPVCTRSKHSESSTFKPRLEMSNCLKRKQKKKKKLSWLSGTPEMKGNSSVAWVSGAMAMKGKGIQLHVETRKCTHCEVTETPQWREGPMGPKTLCNACGVRYRSGRLFPEYRPAASPTFVPYLHSNSHKKVIEMRNRTNHGAVMTQMDAEMDREMSSLPEFVQSLNLNSSKKVVEMRNRTNHGTVMTQTDAEMEREMSPLTEFVQSLHLNSRKKVVEMRNRANHGAVMTETDAEMDCEMSPPPEFVPISSYLFDCVQKIG